MRPRDRFSGMGLLPRMEARPRKDGKTTYRYHPLGAKPINLGTDREAAMRKVLDMNGRAPDRGTIGELWRLYRQSSYWAVLAESTQRSYTELSVPLLKVFDQTHAHVVKPSDVARYLRVERAAAPVVANREVALLSNLFNLAVERGDLEANPCKQVRRNKEQPRRELTETADLAAFIAWAWQRGGQAAVLAGMAEFCAIAGSRRIEFRPLHWTQVHETGVRTMRAKQRGKVVVEHIAMSDRLLALLERLRPLAADARAGAVFPNSDGNPHTERGFKSAWTRLMAAAVKAKVLTKRIRFHDLRAYYATHHKAAHGALPDLHANTATTARVYDRTTVVKRRAL
jgi:integrase